MTKFNFPALVLLSVLLAACSSVSSKPESSTNLEPQDMEEGRVLTLPRPKKSTVTRSPFFNTQQNRIAEKNGFTYDFYYGRGGRYLITITSSKGNEVDFSTAEVNLLVDAKGRYPEMISLSSDSPQTNVFLGNGKIRSGKVDYTLSVYIPATRYNGELKADFSFVVPVQDVSKVGEISE